MLVVVGTLFLSAALFVFAWARVAHQRAQPARWVRYEVASQLLVFAILMLMSTGGGLILHAIGNYETNQIGPVEGGLIVAIVVATLLLFPAYRRYSRQSLTEAATATVMGPTAVIHGGGPQGNARDPEPPDRRTPSGRRRRAA